MAFKPDLNTQSILENLYPGFRDPLLSLLFSIEDQTKLIPRLTSGFRTLSEQQALYEQGRIKPGPIVTHADLWESFHGYGLAADFCFRGKDPYISQRPDKERLWALIGSLSERLGITWGGKFKKPDKPHFEMSFGLYWENCKSLCEDAGIAHLWTYLDQKRGVTPGYGWNRIPAIYQE